MSDGGRAADGCRGGAGSGPLPYLAVLEEEQKRKLQKPENFDINTFRAKLQSALGASLGNRDAEGTVVAGGRNQAAIASSNSKGKKWRVHKKNDKKDPSGNCLVQYMKKLRLVL